MSKGCLSDVKLKAKSSRRTRMGSKTVSDAKIHKQCEMYAGNCWETVLQRCEQACVLLEQAGLAAPLQLKVRDT